MSWGFEATNTSGQVLVSSETRNLHFVGKAQLNRSIKTTNGYGGVRHYAYRIDCQVIPMPFFSMPSYDFFGVVAVREVSVYADRKTWEIELVRSGTSDLVPEVYVFCDPRGITTAPQTNYGMQVMRDDGTLSFDSRYRPLTVVAGASAYPPSNPLTVSPPTLSGKYCQSDTSDYLGANNHNTFTLDVSAARKPIYFYPSIAQAQREFAFHESEDECDGFGAYGGCLGFSRAYDWYSYYWAFYRGAIRQGGDYLHTGWVAVEWGCNWTYQKKSEFIGIGIGGDSGQGGKWPYSNETLNLTPTAVIVADGLKYD